MNVLFCTTVLPGTRKTGGEIATQSFIDALRQAGHKISVLGYRRVDDSSVLADGEYEVGCRPIETDSSGLQAYLWLAASLWKHNPYSSEKYVSYSYIAAVREHISSGFFDLVIVDHAQMGFLIKILPSGIPFVYIAHNVEEQIYKSQMDSATGFLNRWVRAREARLIGILENKLAELARQVWVLTEHDCKYFARLSNEQKVIICRIPATAQCSSSHIDTNSTSCEVGIIGTWTWEANAAGLLWFQREVVPLLPSGWRIYVAGKGASSLVNNPVTSLGFVDDAMHFLRSSKVVCIPSIAGGGVQVKTLDAIASGRPIVATPTALRGIDSPPTSVISAETPQAFATALIQAVETAPSSSNADALLWSVQRRQNFNERIQNCIARFDVHVNGVI